MKRYFIDGSCECGRIDDAEAHEDENGEWIKYEDYEKEQANGIKPPLCDGWRDCRKELPDIDIPILLFLNNGEYRIGKFAGKAYGFKTSSGDYLGNEHPMDFKANSAPKAWMPLPDPPAFA